MKSSSKKKLLKKTMRAKFFQKLKELDQEKAKSDEQNQNLKDHLKQILILSKASSSKLDFKRIIRQGFMFMERFLHI